MISRRKFAVTLAALPFGLGKIKSARAQAYPERPLRFVVPFPPAVPPTSAHA